MLPVNSLQTIQNYHCYPAKYDHRLSEKRLKMLLTMNPSDAFHMGCWDKFKDIFRPDGCKKKDFIQAVYYVIHPGYCFHRTGGGLDLPENVSDVLREEDCPGTGSELKFGLKSKCDWLKGLLRHEIAEKLSVEERDGKQTLVLKGTEEPLYEETLGQQLFSLRVNGKAFADQMPDIARSYALDNFNAFAEHYKKAAPREPEITKEDICSDEVNASLLVPVIGFSWKHNPVFVPLKEVFSKYENHLQIIESIEHYKAELDALNTVRKDPDYLAQFDYELTSLIGGYHAYKLSEEADEAAAENIADKTDALAKANEEHKAAMLRYTDSMRLIRRLTVSLRESDAAEREQAQQAFKECLRLTARRTSESRVSSTLKRRRSATPQLLHCAHQEGARLQHQMSRSLN